jgi:hypothetical protein
MYQSNHTSDLDRLRAAWQVINRALRELDCTPRPTFVPDDGPPDHDYSWVTAPTVAYRK